jgi:hypothetical protein
MAWNRFPGEAVRAVCVCGLILLFTQCSGCTDTHTPVNYTRYAGEYVGINAPDHTHFTLYADGNATGSSDRMRLTRYAYTINGTTITICATDPYQCGTGTINGDGSIDMSKTKFRKV